MDILGSKIRLSSEDISYLYKTLTNGVLIQQASNGTSAITEDLHLIHLSLKAKLEKKIAKHQKTYIIQFNVFEILYIQTMLEFLVPYLGIRTAEYQNYLFDHKQDLSQYHFGEIKEVHQSINTFYRSMHKLLNRIQQLESYYKNDFCEIMDMSLEDRVNALLKINDQLQTKEQESTNVVYIHTEV